MSELSELGCTCVQLNGKKCGFEDRNYNFCHWCVECFEGMAAVDECYIEYGGPEYNGEFAENYNQVLERPISRKRKRTLQKKGKCVYWSKRLESYVYVMSR